MSFFTFHWLLNGQTSEFAGMWLSGGIRTLSVFCEALTRASLTRTYTSFIIASTDQTNRSTACASPRTQGQRHARAHCKTEKEREKPTNSCQCRKIRKMMENDFKSHWTCNLVFLCVCTCAHVCIYKASLMTGWWSILWQSAHLIAYVCDGFWHLHAHASKHVCVCVRLCVH